MLERAAGIEPASLAWKAKVLPLHNARSGVVIRHRGEVGNGVIEHGQESSALRHHLPERNLVLGNRLASVVSRLDRFLVAAPVEILVDISLEARE